MSPKASPYVGYASGSGDLQAHLLPDADMDPSVVTVDDYREQVRPTQ